jgi:hypothetical protein
MSQIANPSGVKHHGIATSNKDVCDMCKICVYMCCFWMALRCLTYKCLINLGQSYARLLDNHIQFSRILKANAAQIPAKAVGRRWHFCCQLCARFWASSMRPVSKDLSNGFDFHNMLFHTEMGSIPKCLSRVGKICLSMLESPYTYVYIYTYWYTVYWYTILNFVVS